MSFQLHFAVHFPSSALTGNKDFGVHEKVVKTGPPDVNYAASSSLPAAKTVPRVQQRSDRGYSLADVFPSQDLPTGLALKAPQVPLLVQG